MKSILQNEKECWFCKTTEYLEVHHCISGWANRDLSEKYGLKIYLCHFHHTMVHHNREEELKVKRFAQEVFEETHSREDFRQIFGKSWL